MLLLLKGFLVLTIEYVKQRDDHVNDMCVSLEIQFQGIIIQVVVF
jgi:hypothetical protein